MTKPSSTDRVHAHVTRWLREHGHMLPSTSALAWELTHRLATDALIVADAIPPGPTPDFRTWLTEQVTEARRKHQWLLDNGDPGFQAMRLAALEEAAAAYDRTQTPAVDPSNPLDYRTWLIEAIGQRTDATSPRPEYAAGKLAGFEEALAAYDRAADQTTPPRDIKQEAKIATLRDTADKYLADASRAWKALHSIGLMLSDGAMPNGSSVVDTVPAAVRAELDKLRAGPAHSPAAGTVIAASNPADTLKMIRETLCAAQSAINHWPADDDRKPGHVARLGRLIDDIDRQRPLGPDGKHGDRHTTTCGCEA